MDAQTPKEKLTVEIKNRLPIELMDLATCFSAIGNQFAKSVQSRPDTAYPFQAKLYVHEMRHGSTIADLVTIGVPALAIAGGANTIMDFSAHLQSIFTHFLTPRSERGSLKVDKEDCDDITGMLGVTARDPESQINFIAQAGSTVNLSINLDSRQSARIIQGAQLEKNRLEQPSAAIVEHVVLYWYQARNELKNKTGDKGIIESISKSPVKIIIPNEKIKAQIIDGQENLFQYGYEVSVQVETVLGRPAAYKILELHDKFKIEEDPEL